MSRPIDAVAEEIGRFNPMRSPWGRLEELAREVAGSRAPGPGADALLGVFERHPGAMAEGQVFFGVIHTLEQVPDNGRRVVESLRRQPSLLATALIQRMLNAGVAEVGRVSLPELLQESLTHPECTPTVRREIKSVLDALA